jgi:hypothetical protein
MKKEFCTYEQALALKELGFDERCFGYYADKTGEDKTIYTVGQVQGSINSMSVHFNSGCSSYQFSAPLYQQAFRWFREKEYYSEITTECTQVDGSVGFSWRIWKPWTIEEWSINKPGDEWSYETYEEAESACLDKLIEIVRITKFINIYLKYGKKINTPNGRFKMD